MELRCSCGSVRGEVRGASAATCLHVVCHCDDCQTYAHALKRADVVLDAAGGTRIVQTVPSRVTLTAGVENVRCLRLSPKGLLRFYAGCCGVPLANRMPSAKVPFIGLAHTFHGEDAEAVVGPVIARIQGRWGTHPLPEGTHPRAPVSLLGKSIWRIGGACLTGQGTPACFLDAHGQPIVEPEVLTLAARTAARELVPNP